MTHDEKLCINCGQRSSEAKTRDDRCLQPDQFDSACTCCQHRWYREDKARREAAEQRSETALPDAWPCATCAAPIAKGDGHIMLMRPLEKTLHFCSDECSRRHVERRRPTATDRGVETGVAQQGSVSRESRAPKLREDASSDGAPSDGRERRSDKPEVAGGNPAPRLDSDDWLNEHAETILTIVNMTCTRGRAIREVAHYLRSIRNECRGGESVPPDASKQRIKALEKALFECIRKCEYCGVFATWKAHAPSGYGYDPSFCDACKVEREKERHLGGRLVGKLVYETWTRLAREIDLAAVYYAKPSDSSSEGEEP